jgi:hypothetical protein
MKLSLSQLCSMDDRMIDEYGAVSKMATAKGN